MKPPPSPSAALLTALACLAGNSNPPAAGGSLPHPRVPDSVGVNIHFTRGHEADLDLIAAGGFRFVRMDFSWGGTERVQGRYTWDEYEELTTSLEKRGLRALYILDYSNALYEDPVFSRDPISGKEVRSIAAPRKPESVAAFARWAGAAAGHFRGRGILWEIWNEPNIHFWKPEPDVRDYANLALATCRAIRDADPEAAILAPASSGFPWAFFETLFQSGALEHLDAVSVHPYRSYSLGPETAGSDYLRLRALIERHTPPGRDLPPILSGEWGYATHTKGVSPETQAAFLARQQLTNLHHGIPLSIWYDWKNDGTEPAEREHNFGVVTPGLQPKPAYRALQTLTTQLHGCRAARRLFPDNPEAWVLLCVTENGGQRLAAWTTGAAAAIRLNLGLAPGEKASAVDGLGQTLKLIIEPPSVILALNGLPQYIGFERPLPALAAAAAWQLDKSLPVRVAAGGEPLHVPVQVSNPFDWPCQVRLELEATDGAETAQLRLLPGQKAVHRLTLPLTRRDDEFPVATVRATYLAAESGRETVIGASCERRSFVLANPLRMSMAPAEAGLRLTIANPAQDGFEGTAIINAVNHPVRIPPGTAELTLTTPRGAASSAAAVELRSADGKVVLPAASQRFQALAAPAIQATLDGDPQIPAKASLTETAAPVEGGAPYPRAWRLDYQFESGWRFVRCVPSGGRLDVAGRPAGLGLWVHGDGSGNSLRTRVVDSSGQTFQPTGPGLDWTGWRWVAFDLANLDRAGHWGGAGDGHVHGTLRLDTLLLVDSLRNQTSGTVHFAGPMFIHTGQ